MNFSSPIVDPFASLPSAPQMEEWTMPSLQGSNFTVAFAAGTIQRAGIPGGGGGSSDPVVPPNPTIEGDPLPMGDVLLPLLACAAFYALRKVWKQFFA